MLQNKTSIYNSGYQHQSKHQQNKLALNWGSSTANFGLEILGFGKVITESWKKPCIKSCDKSKPLQRRSMKCPGCVGLWEMHSVERYWWYRVWEWIRIRIWIKANINETINFRSMKASGPMHIGLEGGVTSISTLELQTFPSTEPWRWCFFLETLRRVDRILRCTGFVNKVTWEVCTSGFVLLPPVGSPFHPFTTLATAPVHHFPYKPIQHCQKTGQCKNEKTLPLMPKLSLIIFVLPWWMCQINHQFSFKMLARLKM